MWLAAALLTALCFGTNNIVLKWGAIQRYANAGLQFFYYAVSFLLVFGYGMVTDAFQPSLLSLGFGALIGILNAVGNIHLTHAYERGPASLVSPLVASNTVLSVLAAGLVFHESIPLVHWVGIVLIFGSVLAIQYKPGQGVQVRDNSWILRVLVAVFAFGFVGILMKGSSFYQLQPLDVLVAMYGGGTIYLAFGFKRSWFRRGEMQAGAIVGLLSAIGYSSYFYALNNGVASVIFPVVSLNCLIVMAGGYLFFAERLKRYQLIGVGTALLGLVLTKV